MALESSEVRVAGTGHAYVAPIGTPIPAGIDSPLTHAAGWVELGYTTTEGARFSFGREVNRIMGWQAFDPLRIVVTQVPKSVSVDLLQWNQHTVKLALGGGTVTEPISGQYQYEPADESFVDERMFAVEGIDGDYNYRFIYRKALNESGVDFAFVRENPVVFPITMAILAADGGAKPYLIQTDDPNVGLLTSAAS